MYEMQESNLPNEEGKRILYPRIKLTGQRTLDDIANQISHASTFTPGDIKGLVQALVEEISYGMANGQSVKIEGLGIFTPALGLRKGAERETGEPGAHRRNASSICVSDIHFRADKELVEKTGRQCQLERSEWKFRKSSQRYTPQERLKLAQDYLAANPFLTVKDYGELTGLLSTAAGKELRQWSEQEDSGIQRTGRGVHRVYIKK